MKKNLILPIIVLSILVVAADYKPITLSPDHDHDKFNTQPKDIVKSFRAFTVSFDSADDDDGDGKDDLRGQPEWVAYQINKITEELPKGPKRPSSWMTDKTLNKQGIPPKDNTYKNSGYSRGHMCMKHIAWRLGAEADWNTHTTLNACPQSQPFNAGIWLNLEYLTEKWANDYGKVWVICGPIFYKDKEIEMIGDEGEMKIPVPHAFFKIVIREKDGGLDSLAFVYPHRKIEKVDGSYKHKDYLKKIDEIEVLTGIDFLTGLEDEEEENLEGKKTEKVWE